VNPLTEIFTATHAATWICRLLVEVVDDLLLLPVIELSLVPALASVPQSFQSTCVVTVNPRLDRATRDTQRRCDLRGRLSLLGQDDHLQPQQQTSFVLLSDEALQRLNGMVIRNMHK